MNWMGLLSLALSVLASLMCITFHEVSHGYIAYRLGDDTAKRAGRLTLNPLRHIDPFGLLLMVVAHVGWAKPVPVDMRSFRHPRRGMALTALAGPASNFILAAIVSVCASLWYRTATFATLASLLFFAFLCRLIILNVGLGLFNLIPVPPLDGSKILFSFLPDRIYRVILRYERYVMLAVVALVFFGVLDAPLSRCINAVLFALCRVTGLPFGALAAGSQILSIWG